MRVIPVIACGLNSHTYKNAKIRFPENDSDYQINKARKMN